MLKNLGFLIGLLLITGAVIAWALPRSRVSGTEAAGLRGQRWTGADQTLIEAIDGEFSETWGAAGLEVAPEADWLTLARRLSLGLTGTIPSLEEIRRLEALPEDERIAWWTDYLLHDRRYADYVAERLARAYVGVENGPFLVFRRRRFVHWLSDELYRNRPYHELVQDLLVDRGLWTDSPAVNFVSVTLDQNNDNQPDPIRLAARTSRAFLGLRIDCLQCHDDNLGTMNLGAPSDPRGGTQQDFHQLAAFFSDVRSTFRGIQETPEPTDYVVQFLDAEEETAVGASVPYRPDLLPDEGSRRRQLATWITHRENTPFARAMVNRMWAILCGKPLVEPVDDLPLHGPFPPGLERLANDFIEHGYDVRRLITLITRTAAFRHDSRAEFDIEPEHEQTWAVFPVTRLRPEQMAGAAIQASSLRTINAQASAIERLARFGQENEFVQRYGDLGEDEFNLVGGTIPQRLILMNGKLIAERTEPNGVLLNAVSQIAALSPDAPTAIETAYLAVLTRTPTPDETRYFSEQLGQRDEANWQEKVSDLYWVLMNSAEFSWGH